MPAAVCPVEPVGGDGRGRPVALFTCRSPAGHRVPYGPASRRPYHGHIAERLASPRSSRDAGPLAESTRGRSIVSSAEQGDAMAMPTVTRPTVRDPMRADDSDDDDGDAAAPSRPRSSSRLRDVARQLLRRASRSRASRSTCTRHGITALIGPSGCGKSTLLRSFNRMNDLIAGAAGLGAASRTTATTSTRPSVDPVEVRRRIGMVFQKPNPFPKSIYDNVAFGPRINGRRKGLDDIVEQRAAPGRAVGRGEGQAEAVGVRALGRPAAAAVHRALPRGRARRDPDGRAVLGARPDRDVAHRRPHGRPQARVHDRDRHPQHAAGGARLRHDRVHDRPTSTTTATASAGSSSTTRPTRSSPTRPTRAPRVTSPVGSDESTGSGAGVRS